MACDISVNAARRTKHGVAFLVLDTDVVIFIIADFPDSFVSLFSLRGIYIFLFSCIASRKRDADSGLYKSACVNLFSKLSPFKRVSLQKRKCVRGLQLLFFKSVLCTYMFFLYIYLDACVARLVHSIVP